MDLKIDLHTKSEIKVLSSDKKIIAILGYRTSEIGKITKTTKKVFLIKIK